LISASEVLDEVQAFWASVVGVSPLPNVLADNWYDVGLKYYVLYALFVNGYGMHVKR